MVCSLQLIAPKFWGLDLNLLRNHGTDVCSLHQAHLGQGCSLRWRSNDFAHKVHMKTSREGDVKTLTQHRSFSNPSPWGIINWSLTHHLAPLEHFNELSIINTVWSYAEFLKNLPVINRSCANARRNCKTHPLKIFTVYSVCLWYICAKSLQTKVYWL